MCRCENVTCGEIRAAIAEDARDVSSVKLHTRLGMGTCQGRECSPPAELLISQLTGRPRERVGRINPRPPARPVSLAALANVFDGSPLDLVGGES
jgi:bacterioferritin-associated ferredoxin